MAISKTFTWFPDVGSTLNETPAVTSSKFGDGYEQRTPKGINNNPGTWTVTFTRARGIGLPILAFIRSCAGSEAFNWTNPNAESGVYVCRKWQVTSTTPEVLAFTADFEQVFDL